MGLRIFPLSSDSVFLRHYDKHRITALVDRNGNEVVDKNKQTDVVVEAEVVEEKENASEEEVKKEGIVKEKKKTNSSKKVKISTKDEDKKTTKKVK